MRPALALLLLATAAPALAQPADPAAVARIIDEGTTRSQVVLTAQYLSDRIGARLTNSPSMRQAETWTQAKFAEWGLKNVHKEGFAFGPGWSIERSSVRMTAPRPIQLTAIPIAWTPPTPGAITAPIVVAPMTRERDFAKWRGQLKGKIVLVTRPTGGSEPAEAPFKRLSDEDIRKLDQYQQPTWDPAARPAAFVRNIVFARKLDAFLKAEGAVAFATQSYRDGMLLHGEGYQIDGGAQLPGVQIAAEDYRRLTRLAKLGPAPTLEIDSRVAFDRSDPQAYNVFAEIPGTDPKAGYVMAGAHLDSWVAGDGAADNGAGSAMIMEAARILAKSGFRPRRTIRFALWTGEEQGLLGSIAFAERHLGTRGATPDTSTGVERYAGFARRWPVVPAAGNGDLAAYFNIDNGSGKLRGLYAERNLAAVPILKEWLAPFATMGAGTVVIRTTGGTDHEAMQALGVPGFQFIQDPLDYGSRVHHSSIDTFDHLKPDDLRQGSIVLASVLLSAANAPAALPRPPLPTEPVATDPFAYPEPEDD